MYKVYAPIAKRPKGRRCWESVLNAKKMKKDADRATISGTMKL